MSSALNDSDGRMVIAQQIITNVNEDVDILKSESFNHTDEIAMLNAYIDDQEIYLSILRNDIQYLESYSRVLEALIDSIEIRLEELEGYPWKQRLL